MTVELCININIINLERNILLCVLLFTQTTEIMKKLHWSLKLDYLGDIDYFA